MSQGAGDITYSIVRPTAFFKSLAGQVSDLLLGKASGKCSTRATSPSLA